MKDQKLVMDTTRGTNAGMEAWDASLGLVVQDVVRTQSTDTSTSPLFHALLFVVSSGRTLPWLSSADLFHVLAPTEIG